MKSTLERLAEAIGYPDRVADGSVTFVFQIDGADIVAEEADGRLRLVLELDVDDSKLLRFAAYAPGRIMKEDAILSYGNPFAGQRSAGSRPSTLFLWQDVPSSASGRELTRLFETFADSCDWWRERAEELADDNKPVDSGPEMMIRP